MLPFQERGGRDENRCAKAIAVGVTVLALGAGAPRRRCGRQAAKEVAASCRELFKPNVHKSFDGRPVHRQLHHHPRAVGV